MNRRQARRIIFVNRFFYPDHSATSELLSDLAFSLRERGYSVSVVTSRMRYDAPKATLPTQEVAHGVEISRVWTSRRGRDRLLGRLLDYSSFYLSAGWRLWRLARRGDVIVAKTDPPLISIVAACVAGLRGTKFVSWQQDLFPEVAEALQVGGKLGTPIYAAARPLRDWSLRRADMNVAIGTRMADRLRQLGIREKAIRTISNWSHGELVQPVGNARNPLRKKWGVQENFVVGYAGNLGRSHEIETVLSAMEALNHDPTKVSGHPAAEAITFLFIGGGALRRVLEEEAKKRQLTNIQFHPYQPRDQLALVLGAADAHLVMLDPRLEGLVVPSKTYAVAAAGRPAIFVGDRQGEVARMLESEGWGFSVETGNATELKRIILRLACSPDVCSVMGRQARASFDQNWNAPLAISKWDQLFQELMAERSPSRR